MDTPSLSGIVDLSKVFKAWVAKIKANKEEKKKTKVDNDTLKYIDKLSKGV